MSRDTCTCVDFATTLDADVVILIVALKTHDYSFILMALLEKKIPLESLN